MGEKAEGKAFGVMWAPGKGFWMTEITWGLYLGFLTIILLVAMIMGDWEELGAIFGMGGGVYVGLVVGDIFLGLFILMGIILNFYALCNCGKLDQEKRNLVQIWSGGTLFLSWLFVIALILMLPCFDYAGFIVLGMDVVMVVWNVMFLRMCRVG